MYRRLPGKGPRQAGFISLSFSRCSLYLGVDHILAVESNGFSEDYKHFYFSDIQAIITRKTRRWIHSSIVLSLLLAVASTGALLLEMEHARIFFLILSAGLLVGLLVNILRGPTCICHITTAVQQDQLPSLNRLRIARRVTAILRQSIEKVQGPLSPEEISMDQAEGVALSAPSGRRLRRPQAPKAQIRHDHGTVHLVAFALLLLDGVVTGAALLHHTPAMTAVSYVLTLLYTIGIVVALVRQHGSDIAGTVRRVTWASLGFICVSYFLSYILMVMAFMANPPKGEINELDVYGAVLALAPQSSPVVMAIYVFAAACSLILGTLGLLTVKRHRDQSARRPRPDLNRGGELAG